MSSITSLVLPAPAKINHFLHILGKRADNYHNLETYFQFIDLQDILSFSSNNTGEINVITGGASIPLYDNLVYKIAKKFQAAINTHQGVNIQLKKNIPIGAGLGGGSSNAATTLIALNHLWQANYTVDQLVKFGAQLGADIPIFILGHAAFGEGIGEKLTPYCAKESSILLLLPNCEVLSAKLFCDEQLTRDTISLKIDTLIDEGLTEFTDHRFKNDFEQIARRHYPLVEEALTWLSQTVHARLSGTGASVFAMLESETKARNLAEKLPKHICGLIVNGLNTSPLVSVMQSLGLDYWGVAKR